MGWYVHLNVVFHAYGNDAIAVLAQQHHQKLSTSDSLMGYGKAQCSESKWFLQDLATRSGANPGPKGGLSLWGIVGNHTDAEAFVDDLKPFFGDLLRNDFPEGPCPHDHILVFYEPEQKQSAGAYEIYLDEDTNELHVSHHKNLPFCWNQF